MAAKSLCIASQHRFAFTSLETEAAYFRKVATLFRSLNDRSIDFTYLDVGDDTLLAQHQGDDSPSVVAQLIADRSDSDTKESVLAALRALKEVRVDSHFTI